MINEFKKPTFDRCCYKNGKLYMFTAEKITVVKMTPHGPAAWSKSEEKPYFTPCRLPQIHQEAIEEAVTKCDDAEKPKPAPEMSANMGKYYKYHMTPQANFFRDKFDRTLLEKVNTYRCHQLDMYKLLMIKGGSDLVESNPTLAYMVALNWIFCQKKVAKPWRRAKSMLKMKRKKILAMCGFPESESLVHILNRIGPVVHNILFVRKALERNPELLRTLSFVENFNRNVISLATMSSLSGSITAQFLNEAAQISEDSEQYEQLCLVRDTARMSAVLGESLGKVKSIKAIRQKHDEFIVPYTAKMKLVMADASFPEPPFDGVSASDFEICPVTTPEMLHRWAVRQHNCVMTSFGSIVMAQSAIYMVTKPVEATLEVLRAKTEDNWKLGQFKGTCNTDVPEIVTEHMRKWFNERKDSPRHIEAPKSLAGFTLSEYYAYIAANGLPVPAQLEYLHYAEEALNQNKIEMDTEFAPGPLPEYEGLDFMLKPVRRGEEMTEVLVYNPNPPRTYLESAKAGEIFVYITGISVKRLVFLSTENFPERKIEIERVFPHSEHIMVRLREWIDNYVYYNGFPMTFKDENQMELVFA